ncbi:MAG TPA: hypothetical protein VHI52_12770, partial [Verrucomicrobiae bacterium]|nr:hypothetical protein [Verrucomicrobiae bacterium]
PSTATSLLPSLNVAFPVNPTTVGGAAADGTAVANQAELSVTNQSIANWPPGAALWLVWKMADSSGKAQGLAIDHLSFSASEQPGTGETPTLTLQQTGGSLIMSWPTLPGRSYQVEYKDDLNEPNWTPLGGSLLGDGTAFSVTNNTSVPQQRFYRVRIGN